MKNLSIAFGKLLLFIALIAIIFLSMMSCTKDEPLVEMRKAEPVKSDSTSSSVVISGWGNGPGQTTNGEGE